MRPRIGRWATVEAVGDEQCLVRIAADSLDWPMMALGSTGEEFEILGPPAMLEYAHQWVERFTRGFTSDSPA